jgi:hypothetical protein
MANFQRSQSLLPALTRQLAPQEVRRQSFQHTVAKEVSPMAGIDPFAGDMTKAFQQFFGNITNTLSTVAETQNKIKIEDAKELFKEGQKQAATDAIGFEQMFGPMPDPSNTAAHSAWRQRMQDYQDTNKDDLYSNDRHRRAFEDVLGQSAGARMWNDWAVASVDIKPENYESAANEWWSAKFGKGTGNVGMDFGIQSAWARNFEKGRAEAKLRLVQNQKETNKTELYNWGVGILNSPQAFNGTTYLEISNKVRQFNPGATDGAVRAMTLDVMKLAAQQNPNSAAALSSFLDKPTYIMDDTGNLVDEIAPLSKQFPAEAQKLREDLLDASNKASTIAGTDKVVKFASALGTIESRFPGDLNAQATELVKLHQELQVLGNTSGVSYAQHADLQSKLSTQIAKLRSVQINQARLAGSIIDGVIPSTMDNDTISKTLSQLLTQSYAGQKTADGKPITGFNLRENADSVSAVGALIKNVYNSQGIAGFDKDFTAWMRAGINDASPEVRARFAKAIMLSEINGEKFFQELFKDEPQMASFARALVAGTTSGEDAAAMRTDPNVIAYNDQFKNKKVHEVFFPGEKTEDQKKKYEELLGTKFIDALKDATDAPDWFALGTASVSASLRQRAEQMLPTVAAELFSNGQAFDGDLLMKEVARRLAGNVSWYTPDSWFKQEPQFDYVDGHTGVKNGVRVEIPFANDVARMDGSGGRENIIENMEEAARTINDGLIGLSYTNGTKITDSDIMIRRSGIMMYQGQQSAADKAAGKPAPQIRAYELWSKSTGAGVVLNLNQDYVVKPKSGDERKVQFTGDPMKDSVLAHTFLHPSIVLYPQMQNGRVLFYRLGVKPYFKDYSKSYMDEQMLENMVKGNGWKPPKRWVDPNQPDTGMGMGIDPMTMSP